MNYEEVVYFTYCKEIILSPNYNKKFAISSMKIDIWGILSICKRRWEEPRGAGQRSSEAALMVFVYGKSVRVVTFRSSRVPWSLADVVSYASAMLTFA